MIKQMHLYQSQGVPKENKIVNEQEQNKPVNEGDQSFADQPTSQEPSPESENKSSSENKEGVDKEKNTIINKEKGIDPK